MRAVAHQVAPSQWASQPSGQVHCCTASQSRPGSRAGRASSYGASGRARSGSYPHRQDCMGKQHSCWDSRNNREAGASSTSASKFVVQRPASAGGRESLRATKESHATNQSGGHSGSKTLAATAMLPTEQRCCHAMEPASRNSHELLRPSRSRTKLTRGQRAAPVTWSAEGPPNATSTATRSAWALCPSTTSPCNSELRGKTSRAASSLCSDGLWFEWQRQDVSGGWTSIGLEANRAIEEAYTLGEPLCRFWRDGVLREFDLRIGQEMVSLACIQRVRMPQSMGHTHSTCSTHMVSRLTLDSEESSSELEGQFSVYPGVCLDA